jgi:hypothetical protein
MQNLGRKMASITQQNSVEKATPQHRPDSFDVRPRHLAGSIPFTVVFYGSKFLAARLRNSAKHRVNQFAQG